MARPDEREGTEVVEKPKAVTKRPRLFHVVLLNDDYTTMEFVIEVLKRFFHKTDTEAVHIMLTVHKSGAAVAGVYTRDVAEIGLSSRSTSSPSLGTVVGSFGSSGSSSPPAWSSFLISSGTWAPPLCVPLRR